MAVGHRLELVQGHLLRGQDGAELLDTEESGWMSDGCVRRSRKHLQVPSLDEMLLLASSVAYGAETVPALPRWEIHRGLVGLRVL